jgi:hypothetical protein
MPAYLVTIPEDANAQLIEGKRNVVLFAEDVAAAREAAAMAYSPYSIDGGVQSQWATLFASATVTEIVAGDLEGAVLRVQINDATTPVDVSVTGGAADGVDEICADMVTALNATAAIANASYDVANLLTCAGAADSLGDNTLTVSLTLNGVDLQDLIGTITHEGAAGAALTVQMATDAIALPNAVGIF